MGQSGTVGYHHHHHHYNHFIRFHIVDDGGLILFSFVFFVAFFILDGVLWMSGVECGGWGRVERVV